MTGRIAQEKLTFLSLGHTIAGVIFLPGDQGAFPALVACHGYMDFKENYFEFSEYLARRGIAVLAIDMHGHGESGGERHYLRLDEWVADIRAALDALQEHPLIDSENIGAFGLSSGGTAILECALVEKRIKALITLDATIRPVLNLPERVGMGALNALGRIKHRLTGKGLRISMVNALRTVETANDPEVNARWSNNPHVIEMWSSFPFPGAGESVCVDTIRRVHRITSPTLVLHGAQDKVDSPESARMLYDALTCPKELHIIEGNGHLGHLDRNRQVVMNLSAGWALRHLRGTTHGPETMPQGQAQGGKEGKMKQAMRRISMFTFLSLSLVGCPVLTGCDGSEMGEGVEKTVREISGAELIDKGEKLKQQIRDLNAQDIERIQEDISRSVREQD